MSASRITVLSPVPLKPELETKPGPGVTTLEGIVVGLRTEWIWPAYHVIADEWQSTLEAAGARVVRYQAKRRIDDEPNVDDELSHFLEQIDLAVVGLGN